MLRLYLLMSGVAFAETILLVYDVEVAETSHSGATTAAVYVASQPAQLRQARFQQSVSTGTASKNGLSRHAGP